MCVSSQVFALFTMATTILKENIINFAQKKKELLEVGKRGDSRRGNTDVDDDALGISL